MSKEFIAWMITVCAILSILVIGMATGSTNKEQQFKKACTGEGVVLEDKFTHQVFTCEVKLKEKK